MALLDDSEQYVRAWSIQFLSEDKKPSDAMLAKFSEMAKSDPSPVVRLYLASALQRFPHDDRWSILRGSLPMKKTRTTIIFPAWSGWLSNPWCPITRPKPWLWPPRPSFPACRNSFREGCSPERPGRSSAEAEGFQGRLAEVRPTGGSRLFHQRFRGGWRDPLRDLP